MAMSSTGVRTKKVTTYGRKKTQIISVRADLTPQKGDKAKPVLDTDIISSPLAPIVIRPPLAVRQSHDNIRPRVKSSSSIKSDYTKPLPANAPAKGIPPKKPRAPMTPIKSNKANPIVIDTPSTVVSNSPVSAYVPSTPGDRDVSLSPVVRPRKGYGRRRMLPRSPSVEVVVLESKPLPATQTIKARNSSPGLTKGRGRLQPSIEPEVELLVQMDVLQLGQDSRRTRTTRSPTTSSSTAVERLASICSISTLHDFTALIGSSHLLDLIPIRKGSSTDLRIQKIGEASYSEVYGFSQGADEVVIKVIPLQANSVVSGDDLPDCSKPEDVLKEVEMTKKMSNVREGGFIGYKGSFVVKGSYPSLLLDAWNEFRDAYGTQSDSPVSFPPDQKYALILLEDGGDDLETFKFSPSSSWEQVAAVFWQVAQALATAEEELEFEHRDLHEGQVLITSVPTKKSQSKTEYLRPESCGIKATIIDFGLSRSGSSAEAIYTELPEDVYEGVGEQWDVYRAMRSQIGVDWEGYYPLTNVMWLQYLLKYMLTRKALRKPANSTPLKPTKRILITKGKKGDKGIVQVYTMLKEIQSSLDMSLTLSRTSSTKSCLTTAADVIEFGRREGWIR